MVENSIKLNQLNAAPLGVNSSYQPEVATQTKAIVPYESQSASLVSSQRREEASSLVASPVEGVNTELVEEPSILKSDFINSSIDFGVNSLKNADQTLGSGLNFLGGGLGKALSGNENSLKRILGLVGTIGIGAGAVSSFFSSLNRTLNSDKRAGKLLDFVQGGFMLNFAKRCYDTARGLGGGFKNMPEVLNSMLPVVSMGLFTGIFKNQNSPLRKFLNIFGGTGDKLTQSMSNISSMFNIF